MATRRSTLALRRLGFTFASDGSHAACLASGADGGWYVESWRLPADGPARPTALPLPGDRSESLHSQLVSLADGTVLVCRHDGDRHELVLLSADVDRPPAPSLDPAAAPALGGAPYGGAPYTGPPYGGPPYGGPPFDGPSFERAPAPFGGTSIFDPASPGGPAGPAARERRLAALRTAGLRLLPLPAASTSPFSPSHPDALSTRTTPTAPFRPADAPVAIALGTDARPVTTVWLVRTDGSAPEQVAELPGLHGGGVWLDRAGRLLGLDRVHEGVVRSVVLDLGLGEVTPLLEIGERSNDRLVLFDPDSRFIMVRSDAPGADRLGWGVLGGPAPLRFPDCLHVPGVFLRPVALRHGRSGQDGPDGRDDTGAGTGTGLPEDVRVAVQIDHGATSALALWQPAGHRLDPLPVPAGRLGAVAHWSAGGLRMPYSAPDHPAALATLDVDTLLGAGPAGATGAVPLPLQLAPLSGTLPQLWRDAAPPAQPGGGPRLSRTSPPGWRLDGSVRPADGSRWHPAQSLELAGPAGPLEAVVYGGDAWLSSPQLVLALHGGPADAWLLEFDPALQRMAAEGLAVVAPNQRGSTGYGTGHAMAVRGAWGGPDLEDVLGLLEGIAGQRSALGLEPPALFGVSYGAFLALLAAAHAPPEQVARCAVVAPFLSGARLLAEASAPVRALTTRLGGHEPVTDERGPRDVLQLAHRIGAPLLILHGDRDEVVPVSQSRSLRHELIRLGRVEGVDFRYVEAAGSGHELLAEEGAAVLHELLAGFLRAGRAG
ncbi:alpha/beta fold hydrolase [Kitasatospora sp. NBC_00240]|uniref:S9 family peptidase n=1 Tax=Kitasatospora sp. NBC_00240 TaxID=2903567 RepID=UPI002256B1A7|nr:alpha/beta fold hydrolase [Kitasatospora sp. NBC_00240]MCX5213222.1 alpha/beta fold hydrolase [Kitasatospora sp. NBC_00240]